MIKPENNKFVLRSGETYQFIKSIWNQTIKFLELMQLEGNVLEINQSGLNWSRLTSNDLIGSPLWKASWWNQTQQTQTDCPIKAPLGAIASLSHWVDEDLEGQHSQNNQQQLRLLHNRVRHREVLINSLWEYRHIDDIHPKLSLVDVGNLLLEVIDCVAPPSTLKIEVAPGMPTFITKRLPLQQVFIKLIENVIKHHSRLDGMVKTSAQNQDSYDKFTATLFPHCVRARSPGKHKHWL